MTRSLSHMYKQLLKRIFSLVFLFLLVLNCGQEKKISEELDTDQLKIKHVSENVYQHISYLETDNYGNVPCNGMIFINNKEAIIYDTPANDAASILLINWIELVHNSKIKAIVVTHFHEDCLGGLQPFHDLNIPSYASSRTLSLIKDPNNIKPNNRFDTILELKIGEKNTITQYFGEGHTTDNVVGYIPSEKALFGGCLIKALHSKKGNLADANIDDWSVTVKHIKTEFPDIEFVIPGHGSHGNQELLDYTIELFSDTKVDK